MSQKKVDSYKEYKKNKKDLLKKEKFMKRLEIGIVIAVAVVLVGWLIWSVGFKVNSAKETADTTEEITYLNVDGFENYYENLPLDYSTLNNTSTTDTASTTE